MTQKKRVNQEQKANTGLLIAVFLILAASFFSAQIYEPPQGIIPRVEGLGITGYAAASSFSSSCNSANTVFKTTRNFDAYADLYTSTDTKFGTNVCVNSDSGHTCKSDGSNLIVKIANDGTVTLPGATAISWRCNDGIQNGQETDVDCGGPSCNACETGESCGINLDCRSTNCASGVCSAYPEVDYLKLAASCPSGYTSGGDLYGTNYGANSANPTTSSGYTKYDAGTGSDLCAESSAYEWQTICGVKKPGGDVITYVDKDDKRTCPSDQYALVSKEQISIGAVQLVRKSYPSSPGSCPSGYTNVKVITQNAPTGRKTYTTICAKTIDGAVAAKTIDATRMFGTAQPDFSKVCPSGYLSAGMVQEIGAYTEICYLAPAKGTPGSQPSTIIGGLTDVCFGTGPYHVENIVNVFRWGECSAGQCVFTVSADSSGKVGDCSSNPYGKAVCTGAGLTPAGACSGTDCSITTCQSATACTSANTNKKCAWDPFEKIGNKCRSTADFTICNKFGIKLCNYEDFLDGDYSCLYKDPQTGYYTQACVGSGSIGFWHVPETYPESY